MATVQIGVTPLFKQGRQIICEIDPPPGNHKGGMLHIGKGNACTLQFDLQAGTPNPLAFDGDPFWWESDDCPRNQNCPAPYSNPRVTNKGATLTVDVAAVPTDSAVHYRLNFDNGCYFDPIIIRD
jgi:hypothetical protein